MPSFSTDTSQDKNLFTKIGGFITDTAASRRLAQQEARRHPSGAEKKTVGAGRKATAEAKKRKQIRSGVTSAAAFPDEGANVPTPSEIALGLGATAQTVATPAPEVAPPIRTSIGGIPRPAGAPIESTGTNVTDVSQAETRGGAAQGITGEDGQFVGIGAGQGNQSGGRFNRQFATQADADAETERRVRMGNLTSAINKDIRGLRANEEGRGVGLFGNRQASTSNAERLLNQRAKIQAKTDAAAGKGALTAGEQLRDIRGQQKVGRESVAESREFFSGIRENLSDPEKAPQRDAFLSNALSDFDSSAFGPSATPRQKEQKQLLAEQLNNLDREQSIIGKLMGDSLGIDPSKDLKASDLEKLAVNPSFFDELENLVTGGEVDIGDVPTPLLTALRRGGGGGSPQVQREKIAQGR